MQEYLTTQEAATYLNISPGTLRKYREEIGYFQRERKVLFRQIDLDTWVKRNLVSPGQESQSGSGRSK